VGAFALLETGAGIGLIAPGELAVMIGGVTAGQGHTDLVTLIAIVWLCTFTGDLISYGLGRRLGRGFLLRYGHLVKLTPARLGQVERFLAHHGGKTILIGRFIGLVRAVAPFAAGSSRMSARRFVPATFAASGLWSAAFSVLGYVFWQSFDEAAAVAKEGTFALLAVVVVIVSVVLAWRMLRTPDGRARLRERLREGRARLRWRSTRGRPCQSTDSPARDTAAGRSVAAPGARRWRSARASPAPPTRRPARQGANNRAGSLHPTG
jgi:undecaprenyl-diphosphatase